MRMLKTSQMLLLCVSLLIGMAYSALALASNTVSGACWDCAAMQTVAAVYCDFDYPGCYPSEVAGFTCDGNSVSWSCFSSEHGFYCGSEYYFCS